MSTEMMFVFDLGGIAKDALYLRMQFYLITHLPLFSFFFSLPLELLFRIELKPLLCVQQSPLPAEQSQQPIA